MHKILIVNSQKEETLVWQTGLNALGYDLSVSMAMSGEEAMLEANNTELDLLISEVALPGLSGTELLVKLKANNPMLKGILFCADSENEIQQEVADAGADAFFTKPVDLADLLDSVERTLGLVETMLPTEMDVARIDIEESKPETISLSERVTMLRQELAADCVYLMNDLGQVLVRAGEMPDKEIETKLSADLMAVTFTNNRVSTFLGDHSSNNFSFFGGKTFDLTIFPVGQSFALLLATDKKSKSNIQTVSTAMAAAVKDVFSTLYILGLVTKAGVTGPLRKDSTGMLIDPEMDTVFQDAKSKQINKDEIESFWQSMPHSDKYENIAGGNSLSYEEATELGLAPTENENN